MVITRSLTKGAFKRSRTTRARFPSEAPRAAQLQAACL